MKRYLLGSAVEDDLNSIWDYIAQDNIEAADQWIAKLFHGFHTIADSPGIGHTRKDLTNLAIKFWPIGTYLILYRVRNKQVEIIAVTHGVRDIPLFLQRRQSRQS
jgi:plasmid stabilization system protein ParE